MFFDELVMVFIRDVQAFKTHNAFDNIFLHSSYKRLLDILIKF